MNALLGIDIGGTTTTIAISRTSSTVDYISEQFATPSADGPQAVIDAIDTALDEALTQSFVDRSDVRGVGLATPGPATFDGVLLSTPNMKHPAWRNCPLRAMLQSRLSQSFGRELPVVYIGDGQAAALGEYQIRSGNWRNEYRAESTDDLHQTAAQGDPLQSLVMLIVGTGLGGGEVRDGKVVRGLAGRAGHAGHIFLPPDVFRYEQDSQLLVGNAMATAESVCSLTGLTHQLAYRLTLPQWSNHPLHQTAGSVRDKAKSLRKLAGDHDPLAIELFDDQAAALGVTLLSLNYIGDYDLLVIGGGICEISHELRLRYLEHVKRSYLQRALDGFRGELPIVFSSCGDDAPVIGALAYAAETLKVS